MRQITNTGDLVKRFRTGRKMKQITLGAHLKVNENYIYMVERGLRVPSLKFILGFARLFDINISWIFEKYLRDRMITEEGKIREQFERMVLKKLPDLKLPPSLREKFDKRSGRALRPEWDTPLKRIPIRGVRIS